MADDVTIRFTADVSDLQRGIQQANSALAATTTTLNAGASQINASFANLTQAYVSSSGQEITSARAASEAQIAIARQTEQARFDIALNGAKLNTALIREQAQTGQISRQEELAGLLASEKQREDIEALHLQSLQGLYAQGSAAYANVQRQIDELASQSVLRRQEIDREVNQQIYADYKRTFEQIGSSMTQSVMGLIQGQQTLGQAAQRIAASIVQSFIAARVRFVADWLAGLATNTAATTAAEATQTSAVAAGVATRSGLQTTAAAASNANIVANVLKSITASAAETFAGIFGFLSPVMGPAAAGPAAGGEATVLGAGAGIASFAVGAWSLPSDMVAQVHQGEMIIPAGQAAAVRSALSGGATGGGGAVHVHHSTNFNVQSIDAAGVKQFFKTNGKQILRTINDGVRTGSHLALSKLGRAL
ncbi:conserved hypothetical protein [Methylocella silvestris BL2]|uniref:Bacteriophage tail tape measure C-terminal domain-containing protein n=1 Tax=Methylocella silvestris (strain DSM 15510 / CIP 108128 / LMG 27833 / NCIMB 13906 / BL2) TaxID=395965 RepID=B8EKT5_METSB|nr:hypothetical protein [Methylocella silvestris]ACK51963.1 conserved hypothetical protein [Methylocella silvestris BL2]